MPLNFFFVNENQEGKNIILSFPINNARIAHDIEIKVSLVDSGMVAMNKLLILRISKAFEIEIIEIFYEKNNTCMYMFFCCVNKDRKLLLII